MDRVDAEYESAKAGEVRLCIQVEVQCFSWYIAFWDGGRGKAMMGKAMRVFSVKLEKGKGFGGTKSLWQQLPIPLCFVA